MFHLELEILSALCNMEPADFFSAVLVRKNLKSAPTPGIGAAYHIQRKKKNTDQRWMAIRHLERKLPESRQDLEVC